MKKHTLIKPLLAAALLTPAVASAALDFSDIPYVTYGDGNSYSLPISQLIDTGKTGPGQDYYINSTPGAIQDLVVLATGASGSGVTTNFSGMDNAYATPSGQNGDVFFSTTTANDPGISGGAIVNDYKATWDSSLSALQSFLAGGDMTFFFNNNQENSGGAAAQTLAVWAQLWITQGTSDTVVGQVYEFTNNGGAYLPVPNGGGVPSAFGGDPTKYLSGVTDPLANGPTGGTNANTDYVLSGGQVCLNSSYVPVPCDGSQAYTVNHNLGANEAAYAVMFPELNTQLASLFGNQALDLSQYTLHVDFRMGCDLSLFNVAANSDICTGTDTGYGKSLNNGYEQLFMGSTTRTYVHVPEPGPIGLLGMGALSLIWIQSRRPAATRQRANN